MEADPVSRVAQLERQVARLDAELGELRARVDRADRAATGTAIQSTRWAPPPVATGERPASWPSPAVTPTRSITPDLVIDSETVLKWGGVGLVVLAVGFAVSTAISRNWIGPELQLVGALLVGLGLIGAGLRLRPTRPAWTHALCSGGTLALFTTVASDLFLDQAPDWVADASTAVIGAGGLLLARAIRSEWATAATLAGGAIGWAVIGRHDPILLDSLIWYVALTAAVVALAIERKWFGARLASHAVGMIALLALADVADSPSDRIVLGIGTALVVASLFSIPSIGDLSTVWQQLEVQLAIAAAPWAFAVTFVSTLEPERDAVIGWSAIGMAAGAAAAAVVVRGRIRLPHFVSLLIGASVTLSIGLAVLLSTTVTFVGLAVQGAGLVVLSRALERNVRVLVNALAVTAIASIFVVARTVDAWSVNAPIGDDIAHAFIIAAIAVAGWQTGERVIRGLVALGTLALVMIWLGSILVHLPQGQAAVSISWAIIGTAVFVISAIRRYTEGAATGLVVLGLTVGKLLSVDLREVDTLWRAGLFFLVGVGLMRLGFMLPRLARTPAEADESDESDGAASRPEPTGLPH
jgi:hypothetical protein